MAHPSFVVTGGAQGMGRAIAERLTQVGHVVIVDLADGADWRHERITPIVGDARDPQIARQAALAAEADGALAGWVNNAAVFRDAGLADA